MLKKVLSLVAFILLFGVTSEVKADSSITGLPTLSASPAPGDFLPIVHSGTNYKTLYSNLIPSPAPAVTTPISVANGGVGSLAGIPASGGGITKVVGFGDSWLGNGGNTSITGYCTSYHSTVAAGAQSANSGCMLDQIAEYYNVPEVNNGSPGTCLGTYGSSYYCNNGGAGIQRYTTDLVPFCVPGNLVVFQYDGVNDVGQNDIGFLTAGGIASFQSQMDTMLAACVAGYGSSDPTIITVETPPQTGLNTGIAQEKFQFLGFVRAAVQAESIKYGLREAKMNDALAFCWPDAIPLAGITNCSVDGYHPSNGTAGTSANLGNTIAATTIENATFVNTAGAEAGAAISAALSRPQMVNTLNNYGCFFSLALFTVSTTTPANCSTGLGDVVTARANGVSGEYHFGANIFTTTTGAITGSTSAQTFNVATGTGTNWIVGSSATIDLYPNTVDAFYVTANTANTVSGIILHNHASGVQVEDNTNATLDYNIGYATYFSFSSPLSVNGPIRATAFNMVSKLSSKFNVAPLENGRALSLVDKTKEYRFCYKQVDSAYCAKKGTTRRIGIIADWSDKDLTGPEHNSFDVAAGTAISLAAIRELHAELRADEKKIAELEKEKKASEVSPVQIQKP